MDPSIVLVIGVLVLLAGTVMLGFILSHLLRRRRRPALEDVTLGPEASTGNDASKERLATFTDQVPTKSEPFLTDLSSPTSSTPSVYYDVIERPITPFEMLLMKVPEMEFPWALRQSLLTTIDADQNRNENPWSLKK